MDIYSVLIILCASVAGTSFLTWVPAYRKGVAAGVRKERNTVLARYHKLYLNSQYGKAPIDVNSLYPSGWNNDGPVR